MRSWLPVTLALLAAAGPALGQPSPAPVPSPVPSIERVDLAAAVSRALARNPTAAIAALEVERAEALVRQARAGSLPTVTAAGTLTQLDAPRERAGLVVAPAQSTAANLQMTVPLISPSRWAQWAHAGENVDVARASAADVRRLLALSTARAYLAVVAQQRIAQINERARDTARAHAEFAHTRFAGGVGNRIDEVRAQQELATTEAQLYNAYVARTRAREALGVLLGATGAVDAADPAGLAEPPPTLDAASGEADRRRTDLSLARARARAAEHLERDSWTDYLPLLTGTFQPFYQNPPSFIQPQTGWQAQLILSVPLSDGGLRRGQRRERAALAAEARATLDGALRQARSEVRVAFEAVRQADQALGAARRAAGLAEEARQLAELAYRAGATRNLELIDAQRRALDAATLATIAEDAARQARLDLLAASGRFP